MSIGNKSYFKPVELLDVIVDDTGKKLQSGEERDIREFNDILISRIMDAMDAVRKQH